MRRATLAAAAVLDEPPERVRVTVLREMGRPRRDISAEVIRAACAAASSWRAAAAAAGIPEATFRDHARMLGIGPRAKKSAAKSAPDNDLREKRQKTREK